MGLTQNGPRVTADPLQRLTVASQSRPGKAAATISLFSAFSAADDHPV